MMLTKMQRARARWAKDPRARNRGGWVQLGYMALSFALSYIAGRLLAKKSGLKIDDDKPTTLTTRGAYSNYVMGLRRVGPNFCWAGDREIKKEKAKGGKGAGSSQKTEVFYEAGWHVLCSNGPVFALHQIIQSGKVIFQGPITRDSHPSGSTVNLGKEGSFVIYWGEENQPVNSFLGGAGRVGVTSRWPFHCYVVWNKKRLSTSPQWPVLDYVIDRRPEISETILTATPAYYEPTQTLTGDSVLVFGHTNGVEGTGKFIFAGDVTGTFPALTQVELTGNAMASGTYEVLRSETFQVVIGTNPFTMLPIYATRTNVFLYGGVSGADDLGSLQAYEELPDDGLNPAHIVAEVLFAEWPQGVTCDPDGPEPWDIDSLEAWGLDADGDDMRSSYVGRNGEKASACLAAFLQDYGVMAPIDTATGKMRFMLIREPSGTLPNIALGAQVVALPEIESIHGERAVDKLVFKFADRTHGFGDMTIGIDSDGQASFEENQRSRVVECPTVVNFDSAAKIADRRSQEELAGAAVVTYNGARGARKLIPGQDITIESVPDTLRLIGVEFDPLSSAVKLRCMVDYYGTKSTDFVNSEGGAGQDFEPVEPDPIFDWLEVPEYLLNGDPMTIVIPRVRAHNQIISADLWISRDNTTYQLVGTELNVQTGGLLTAQLDATDPKYEAQSVTFDALGPDIATALDLSGDLTSWMLGRQLCAIVSEEGAELCFVQKITSLGGSSYRLDGLVRARYDTMRLTHPVGAKVFIFENTAIEFVQDVLLVPNEDLYVKTQPNASSGQLPLSSVSPVVGQIRGKGTTPMDPIALHVTAPFPAVRAYSTGNDIALKWGYRSTQAPKTGAGLQTAGVVTGVSLPQGTFTIEILTTGNVLRRTVPSQVLNTYTYTNADLVADFSGEPAAFKVRVTLTNGGFASDPIEITVTKV